MTTIDLTQMPSEFRYEDRYGHYMEIFRTIAYTEPAELVQVVNPPICWIPFLRILGCEVQGCQNYFEHDSILVSMVMQPLDRTAIEVLAGFRPELTDVLWKMDVQWTDAKRKWNYTEEREFIVTTNGSFHRASILKYLEELRHYTPPCDKVVLVPCAADKPYPAPLHSAVLAMLPSDYYLANLTGVLGIVPQEKWGTMPLYDSGVPYEWRLLNVAREYFTRNKHRRIVVYADFYNLAIQEALRTVTDTDVVFVNEARFYADYLNLLDPQLLAKLQKELV